VIPYCSATGTKSTIAALRAARWRLLVVATGHDKNSGLPYALDNGAWSAHVNGRPFDVEKFEKLLDWSASCPIRPDWCVLPDIVGGGLKSLDFSLTWVDTVSKYSKLNLLAVQDGMTPADVEGLVGPSVGLFVGGSTEWKLRTLMDWGQFSRGRCYLHVGRVNSIRRITHCTNAGADSFDGTSVCRFPVNLNKLDRARKQLGFKL
tara:strand:+ start:1034 stop:1648 length:615 start_codon:yes stop_codon:yes gene_type:complete